jgi:hypothetical protein
MTSRHDTTRIEQLCGEFRRKLKLLLARAGLARIIAVEVALFAALAAADWWLHFPTAARVAALAFFVTLLLATGWFTWLRPLRSRWSTTDVLAYLDAAAPGGQGMLLDLYELITAREQIQETESPRGQQLVAAAIEELQPLADRAQVSEALYRRTANRWSALAGLLLTLLVVASATVPQYVAIGAQRLFNPFSHTRWPHRTTIALHEPETGWTVPQWESFTVRAEVTGDVPRQLLLAYRTESNPQWVREKLPVQQAESGSAVGESAESTVTYTFPEVRDPIEFTLTGGDFQTDRQQIEIIRRPYLQRVTAHYTYPRYAGLPDRDVSGGQLAGLEGTGVRLVFECSMPLERAVLLLDIEQNGASPASESSSSNSTAPANSTAPESLSAAAMPATAARHELTKLSATTFQWSLVLSSSGRYAVELYEPHGFREARPEVYEIRVTPDEPPDVELLAPAKDLVETRQASIDVAFAARDKFGLARVGFYYQLDGGDWQPLSDHITGPIAQTGLESAARFLWDLRKMDLPESGTLRYLVRVEDNNPTGRGKVESPRGQISLVRPSEFHLEAVERAKLLEEEARIAWRNQLEAWRLGGKWLREGTGDESDPLWSDMQSAQEKAFLAARQIQVHLRTLTEKYERNHMAHDFMSGRLSVVAELLERLLDQEHPPVSAGLAESRPRSAADAAPDRLKELRAAALGKFHDSQKMSVLVLERMLRKLYDWRDLQNCTLTARLMHEQQDEVLGRTAQIAPLTIAREIEDLRDADQEKLLTLGKQQRAIFDTESGLEAQLTYLMYKAQLQQRRHILDPLQAAFVNLRDNRVNYHLKRASEMIENNQPAQIIDNQKAALRALEVVRAGLVVAGQRVDPDPPLELAMLPADENQFDPDQIKPPELASQQPDSPADSTPTDSGPAFTELPVLPEGADALSAAIRLAIELKDNVLARTRYLHANSSPTEMPRFVELKLLRLAQRQEAALAGIDRAIGEASNEKQQQVQQRLEEVRDEFRQSQSLLAARRVEPTVQQIQADAMDSLKSLLQYLAFTNAAQEAVSENRRLGGVDAFQRAYVLRDGDLDATLQMLSDVAIVRMMGHDVLRKLQRFQQHPTGDALVLQIEKDNRSRAAGVLRRADALLDEVSKRRNTLSAEVAARAASSGLGGLPAGQLTTQADAVAGGSSDAAIIAELRIAAASLDTAVLGLRDLLEQRVETAPQLAVTEQLAEPMSAELFERLTSREHLAELLRNEASLPPEIRELMVRSLQHEFPEKYRELLAAYYASFIKAAQKEEK